MLRGVYTSASGMMSSSHSQRVISDNIANSNTNGYQGSRTVNSPFGIMMMGRADSKTHRRQARLGTMNAGTRVAELHRNDASGKMKETERSTDLALQSPGYFAVEGEEGTLLTRDGQFHVDEEGYLATEEGHRLRAHSGYARVGSDSFEVRPDGTVVTDDNDSFAIEVVEPEMDSLQVSEGGYIRSTDAADLQPVEEPTVRQGFLESSNIDMVRELTLLMTSQRSHAANHTAMQIQEQTLDAATRLSEGI